MKKVTVLLGNFTFIEPKISYPKFEIRQGIDFIQDNQSYMVGSFKAIVHKINETVEVLENKLDCFCEKSLETHEGYLIPSLYQGEIVYEC